MKTRLPIDHDAMKHGKFPPRARMAGLAATALGLAIWAMYPHTIPPDQDRAPRSAQVPGGRSGRAGDTGASMPAGSGDASTRTPAKRATTRDPARLAVERERKLLRERAVSDQQSGSAPRESKLLAPATTGWRELPAHMAEPDDGEERADPATATFHLIEEAALAAERGSGDTAGLLHQLQSAFRQEEDLQVRQSLLDVAHELSGPGSSALLNEALAPSQPEEVRRAALYLASGDRELLETIAANREDELHIDAAALILERKLAAGEVPPPRDTPPGER